MYILFFRVSLNEGEVLKASEGFSFLYLVGPGQAMVRRTVTLRY